MFTQKREESVSSYQRGTCAPGASSAALQQANNHMFAPTDYKFPLYKEESSAPTQNVSYSDLQNPNQDLSPVYRALNMSDNTMINLENQLSVLIHRISPILSNCPPEGPELNSRNPEQVDASCDIEARILMSGQRLNSIIQEIINTVLRIEV